jgi:two-component system, NarL family, sensor kinase
MANKTVYKIILLFCVSCLPFHLTAQYLKNIDSLKQIIASTTNDTVKLHALENLNEINQDRKEKAAGYKQQIALSIKIKEYAAACTGYSQLGYYEFENNNYVASENYFNEGMKLATQTKNYFVMGRISNSLMGIYDRKGDMSTALKYLNQGEKLLIQVDKKVNLTRLYCNASQMFNNHGLVEKGLEYARKAYRTARASEELEPVTTAAFYLASRLQTLGKYDSAAYYFSEGLHIAEQLGLAYTQGDMLKGLSDLYIAKKEYPVALDYLGKAIVKFSSVNVTDRRTECEESLAFLNFMNKEFDKVKIYTLTREKLQTEDSLRNNRYVFKWLANLALINRDVEGWEKYQKKYEQAEAVITNDKIQKNILELEVQYNLSKKESELLQKETENRNRLWIIAALALGLLSIAIIAIAQYRNAKNKHQILAQKAIIEKQNALAEERLRIAADMHDDVGAGLSRIRYITATLHSNNAIDEEGMQKIIALSDDSVEKMNEIIWALNQGNQQLEELIYYTRSQCSEMANIAGLAFTFDLPEKIPAITLGWKECRNIYLLVKEAVNNSIKHSASTAINIECVIAKQLQFTISDNGKGFNPDAEKKTGNGLLNYKKRIEKLDGRYNIESTIGTGTVVSFLIPLPSTK